MVNCAGDLHAIVLFPDGEFYAAGDRERLPVSIFFHFRRFSCLGEDGVRTAEWPQGTVAKRTVWILDQMKESFLGSFWLGRLEAVFDSPWVINRLPFK